MIQTVPLTFIKRKEGDWNTALNYNYLLPRTGPTQSETNSPPLHNNMSSMEDQTYNTTN